MFSFMGTRHPHHAKLGYLFPNMTRLHTPRYSIKSGFRSIRPFLEYSWTHLRASPVQGNDNDN